MKRIILLIILALPVLVANAQETVSGVSKSGYVNISKDPPKPAYLEVVKGSLYFKDANGNNKIDPFFDYFHSCKKLLIDKALQSQN